MSVECGLIPTTDVLYMQKNIPRRCDLTQVAFILITEVLLAVVTVLFVKTLEQIPSKFLSIPRNSV